MDGEKGDKGLLPVDQRLKCLPPMQETQVRSLGQGRFPAEANGYLLQYSYPQNSILTWKILMGSWGHKESDTTEQLTKTKLFS